MSLRLTFIFIFFINLNLLFSQEYELVGLIDHKIVKIDQATGETTFLLEIKNIPKETDLRDLVYNESKQEFYSIANPTDNPYLAKISVSGEFDIYKRFETEFAKFYAVEAISLYKNEIYFSASLDGGVSEDDFYSESLLKVNTDNEIKFLTEINTEKPYPDIDVLQIYEDKIFIFDGGPPSQNFLEFYEFSLDALATSSYPNNIYSSTYLPIADICYVENQLFFVAQKSLYSFNNSISKIVEINTSSINPDKNFVGLAQYLPCPLPVADLEAEIKVCNKDAIILDVKNPNSSYLWSDGSTGSNLTVTESGVYEVEITNACGSKKFTTEVVFQYPPQNSNIQIEPRTCASFLLSPQAYNEDYEYIWEGSTEDSVFTATESGWYSLKTSNECGSLTDSVYIEVKDFSGIVLPNIITPNNDRKNDKFVIDERLQNASLTIFNRYGKLVYQNPRYLNDWDSGNLNSGTYFYRIILECGDIFKGWVEVRK